jgi:hypothetical protein
MNKDLDFGMFAHRYYGKRYTVEVRRQMLVSSLASQVVGEVSVRWVGWNGRLGLITNVACFLSSMSGQGNLNR